MSALNTTQVEHDLAILRRVLGTLITGLPQSANSPIRIDEAERLLKDLERMYTVPGTGR